MFQNNTYFSRSLYIKGVQCHKALWFHKYRPELKDEVSASQQAAFDSGTDVGILAQRLFPGGTEVPYKGLQHIEQLTFTQKLLRDSAKSSTRLHSHSRRLSARSIWPTPP